MPSRAKVDIKIGPWKSATDIGSCEFCTNHINAEGTVPHKVSILSIEGASGTRHTMRACPIALTELADVMDIAVSKMIDRMESLRDVSAIADKLESDIELAMPFGLNVKKKRAVKRALIDRLSQK